MWCRYPGGLQMPASTFSSSWHITSVSTMKGCEENDTNGKHWHMRRKGSDLFYIKIVTFAKIRAQSKYVSVRLV